MFPSTNCVVVSCALFCVVVWVGFFHIYDVEIGEQIKNSSISNDKIISAALDNRKAVNAAIIKPTNVEVLKSNKKAYVPRNGTALVSSEAARLYSDQDNRISKTSVVWADFVPLPKAVLLSKPQPLEPKVLASFKLCSNEIVANLTRKLDGKDFEWCKWALSVKGGNVVVGESLGSLSLAEQGRFHRLGCSNVIKDQSYSCDDERGDGLIQAWRRNRVKDLCEINAESKLNCFDSPGGSRYCQFENAMMNFKRMRNKIRADGTPSRSWEKGFLSASCGDRAKEDIGYFQIYKPDIDGSSDAVCDYVFNETVLAYSHDNVKSFSHMFSDYLNIQSLLWLSSAAAYSKDVTLLNIDSFRMQQYYGDQPNEYFSHYSKSFRRILKAGDFGTSKVCFKNLILQPRPEIQFTRDGWRHDLMCSQTGPSAVFQRWNLQMRVKSGLLRLNAMQTNEVFTILLVTKASKLGSRKPGRKNAKRMKPSKEVSKEGSKEDSSMEVAPWNVLTVDKTPSAQGISNSKELVGMLMDLSKELSVTHPKVRIELIEQDLDVLSFDEQVALVAKTSIIIGMHGTGIAISMHMSVGSTYCCGVIEIFPSEGKEREGKNKHVRMGNMAETRESQGLRNESRSESRYLSLRGHGNMARRMGHQYSRIDLSGGGKVHRKGTRARDAVRRVPSTGASMSEIPDDRADIAAGKGTAGGSADSAQGAEIDTARGEADGIHIKTDPGTHTARALVSTGGENSTTASGTFVSPSALKLSVSSMIESILKQPSCFLPAVVKKVL